MDLNLNENEVGFHAGSIGFPSLKGCMAVVLQTDQGLAGWHVFGSGNLGPRAPEFAAFVQSSAPGTALRLYGICHFEARFGGDAAAWRAEMDQIAAAIGFQGPVQGFDLGQGTKIGADESAFVRVERDDASATCRIGFKRWSKMTAQAKVENKGALTVKRITARSGGYVVEDLYNDKTTPGVDVNRTYWNKGRLHAASIAQMQGYTAS